MEKLNFEEKLRELKQKYGLKDVNIIRPEDEKQFMVNSYNASEGNLDSFDGYNCTLCNNKGHYMYLIDEYEYVRDCKCMGVRNSIRSMMRSGLKNIIKDYTFDKYETPEEWQENIKHKAIYYLEDEKPNWWFINGMSGSGKTHISVAICREYLLRGHNVKYMLWKEDSTVLKACINDYEIYEKKMNKLKNEEILYIDDLFKPIKKDGVAVPPTTADVNLAFELIDYRKNANLRTIISSERNLMELLEIDEATTGRIVEKATKEYIVNIEHRMERNYRLKGIFDTV